MGNPNGYPALAIPGVKLVTLRELVLHVNDLCSKVPDLGYVIVMGRIGDIDNMRCVSNVSRETKLEMLTRVRDALAVGGNAGG